MLGNDIYCNRVSVLPNLNEHKSTLLNKHPWWGEGERRQRSAMHSAMEQRVTAPAITMQGPMGERRPRQSVLARCEGGKGHRSHRWPDVVEQKVTVPDSKNTCIC